MEIFTTENLSRWGAVTGTLGVITGILGLVIQFIKFRHDRQNVKIVTDIQRNHFDGLDAAITVYSLGNDPVYLEKVRFYLRQPGWRRLFAWYFYRQRNRFFEKSFQPTPSLTKNRNFRWEIELPDTFKLWQFARVCIFDQSGRQRRVPWYSKRKLQILTTYKQLNSHEDAAGDRSIKLTSYLIGDEYVLKASFMEKKGNGARSRGFRIVCKNALALDAKLNNVRGIAGKAFLEGTVSKEDIQL